MHAELFEGARCDPADYLGVVFDEHHDEMVRAPSFRLRGAWNDKDLERHAPTGSGISTGCGVARST